MSIFSNSDEPLAPDWYRPGQPDWWRQICWKFRNPFHDLAYSTFRRPVTNPRYIFGKSEPFADEVNRSVVLRFNPFFLKLGPAFIGWRSDSPHPDVFAGKYGPGGGKFDIGIKDLT